MKPKSLSQIFFATLFVAGCAERDLTIGRDKDAAVASDGATTTPKNGSRIDTGMGPSPAGSDGAIGDGSNAFVDTGVGKVDLDAGADAAMADGGAAELAPTCPESIEGVTTCGSNKCESCAASPLVSGGMFYRSYDGVSFLDQGNPAMVGSFRLDKYETTVGRFRRFVDAVTSGWRPLADGGKHDHLNGGRGVVDSSSPTGTFESGWNTAWNNNLSATAAGWNEHLACQGHATLAWTATPGANENMAINCINWYQAYAFCIWDGGFLPTEAEWNYAASGGAEQRTYPWSRPPDSETVDCSYANYGTSVAQGACPASRTAVPLVQVGSLSPKGDGKWGQSDLIGNVAEWTMDWSAYYVTPCVDCAYLSGVSQPVSVKVLRGGSYATATLNSTRATSDPVANVAATGIRCARAP